MNVTQALPANFEGCTKGNDMHLPTQNIKNYGNGHAKICQVLNWR